MAGPDAFKRRRNVFYNLFMYIVGRPESPSSSPSWMREQQQDSVKTPSSSASALVIASVALAEPAAVPSDPSTTAITETLLEPSKAQSQAPEIQQNRQPADTVPHDTKVADSMHGAAADNASTTDESADLDLNLSSQLTLSTPSGTTLINNNVLSPVVGVTRLDSLKETVSRPQTQPSTEFYDQTSFKEFKVDVATFAGKQLRCEPGNLEVYHMHGGSYHRIVGLNVRNTNSDGGSVVDKYILRIPRFPVSKCDIDAEVAILGLLKQETQIPVPRVFDFSAEDDFILNSPFSIQELMPGTNLYDIFPNLDFNLRKRLTRNIAECLVEMLQVGSGTAGCLVFSNPYDAVDSQGGKIRPVSVFSSQSGSTKVGVKPFVDLNMPDMGETDGTDGMRSPDPVHAMLVGMLRERKKEYGEHTGSEVYRMGQMDKFIEVVLDLHRLGYLVPLNGDGHCHYKLAHLDFAARNILVDFGVAEPKSVITAILDWDSAIIAPTFASCRPFTWLWKDWDGKEDRDGSSDDYQFTTDMNEFMPTSNEGKALKQIFDDIVGEEYCEYAYSEVYRLARRLFYFARDGISSAEDFDNMDLVMDRWAALHAVLESASWKGNVLS